MSSRRILRRRDVAAAARPRRRRSASGAAPRLCARVALRRGRRARPADSDQLLPVSSLGGVDAAVELLVACTTPRARIVVVGDFDADGATSTALVVRQLARLGFAHPDYVVPDRFRYRLRTHARRSSARRRSANRDLLVTVDNGISSLEGVAEARRLGIEVLVTDHHLPGRGAAGGGRASSIRTCRAKRFAFEGAGRRRRRVLRHGGADATRCANAVADAPGGRQRRRPARPRRARHRRGRRAARSATTASSSRRACGASAPAAARPACARCSRRPGRALRGSRRAGSRASRPRRAQCRRPPRGHALGIGAC